MSAASDPASSGDVLDFWFQELSASDWFNGGDAVDAKVAARFIPLVEGLEAASYPHAWEEKPEDALALIIALDQFPRNIYRGEARSFLFDVLALDAAQRCVARNDFDVIPKERRKWVLMPYMHSEDLAVQEAGLPLFKAHSDASTYRHAVAHHDVIAEFGRFPHRNNVLGRDSTAAEIAFLADGGYAPD